MKAAAALLAVGLLAGQSETSTPSWAVPEYALKAAFLLNFAKYVEWPAAAFEDPAAPIIIAVLGRDPFGSELDTTFRGRVVRGRPLRLRRIGRPNDISDLHMLFVPRAEERRMAEILERSRAVLVVGESEAFCRSGGALSILVENGKPRIEANPDAAARAELKIDAKLLKVATIIRDAP